MGRERQARGPHSSGRQAPLQAAELPDPTDASRRLDVSPSPAATGRSAASTTLAGRVGKVGLGPHDRSLAGSDC
jgi:hypothetical protein